MAKTIEVNTWCDGLKAGADDFAPRHEPATVRAITRTFALDGKPPKHVDLCDPCNGDLTLTELREVIRQFGVLPDAKKAPTGRSNAATGGPAATAAMHQVSGVRHGRPPKDGERLYECLWCTLNYTSTGYGAHVKKHGFDGIKDALGDTCPIDGETGFDMLSVHVSRRHPEFATPTGAFTWARDNGDEYGVYARRRAAGRNIVEALIA